MLSLLLLMALLALVGIAAVAFGADSRPGFDGRLRGGGLV
jgi:hypothetical protein